MVQDTQPCASSSPLSVLVKTPSDRVTVVRRTTWPSNRCYRPLDWIRYDDPFGDWHEDPCAELADAADDAARYSQQDGGPS